MQFRLVAFVALFSLACQFDSYDTYNSTGSGERSDTTEGDALDCEGFEPNFCGECGIERCVADGNGDKVIQCEATADSCGSEESCDSAGLCITAACSGAPRDCGSCARDTCIDGQWSGQCEIRDLGCDSGDACVGDSRTAAGDIVYACRAGCSTEGFRSVPEGYQPVPHFINLGDSIESSNLCIIYGRTRICTCTAELLGEPWLDCDLRCS